MQVDFPECNPLLDALLARFVKADQRQRAEMVLRAIGAKPHRNGWLLRNNRLIPTAAAPYWASDLNALAAAEALAGLAEEPYAVSAAGRLGWIATAGEPGAPRFRVRASNERDVRALAVVLHTQLQPRMAIRPARDADRRSGEI